MEAYANVLLYVIPFFLVLITIEATYAYWRGNFNFNSMDTISSLSSGTTNTLKSVLGLTFIIFSYEYVHSKVALFEIESTWLVYLLSFIAIDFGTYCHHLLAHKINIFWNRHNIHHSGEEFNLPTALRQSISEFVGLGFIFLLPAALLGLSPEVIAVIAPLHLFMQFWYHTEHIGKLGFLEYIIVTPSQHRVHHAVNKIYMDKNLSAIFCIWDRIFGTFQEELEEEPCVYGVTRQAKTWNPVRINFQHLWLLIKDAWRAEKWGDKFKIWFMPTGWRPEDVVTKYPVVSSDAHNFIKYDSNPSNALKIWSLFQYIIVSILLFHLLLVVSTVSLNELYLYGLFLLIMVYSYSALMDKDKNGIWFEVLKSLFGFGLIYYFGDWFLIENFLCGGVVIIGAYLILSVLVTAYFILYEFEKEQNSIDLLTT